MDGQGCFTSMPEYKVRRVKYGSFGLGAPSAASVDREVNRMARQGWLLVNKESVKRGRRVLYVELTFAHCHYGLLRLPAEDGNSRLFPAQLGRYALPAVECLPHVRRTAAPPE